MFPVISSFSCIYNNKNISKNKEETTIVYYFHSLSGTILNFVALSEKAWSKIRTASDLSTIQFHEFRLIFKGHKSLEYCCLVIHLTSVSTLSYAESNGTRTNVARVICQQIIVRISHCERFVNNTNSLDFQRP